MKRQYIAACCLVFLLGVLFLSLAGPALAGRRVNLDITGAEARKVPVAIPYFQDLNRPGEMQKAGRDLAVLAGRALDFHGFLRTIPPESYGGRQDADWTGLGVDYVVLGQYVVLGDTVNMEIRLQDVAQGKMILGRKFSMHRNQSRKTVLKYCDQVIEQLTGIPGVSTTKIAFVSDRTGNKEIFFTDIFGESVRQVTRHKFLSLAPRLSPDGSRLAYTSYHRGNANLYITDLSQDKTTKAISRRVGLNMAPAWTPDGRTMLVTLSKDGNPDLYQMNMDGSIVRRLTTNAGINVSPSFSPDGGQIAFVSDRTGQPQVYIMDFHSGSTRRLTYQGNENTTPAWSPDGKWIAYTARTDGSYQLFKISPEGGAPIQLTASGGDHEAPSWSPDSRQIVFSRTAGSGKKLYAIFHNGQEMRQLFSLDGNQITPQWSTRLD